MDRVYLFISSQNITVSEFSKKIEVSNGYFAKQKANEASIGSNILEKIVSVFPQVNLNWLITGKGDMLNTIITTFNHKSDDGKTSERVPLFNIEAVAGIVAIFEDMHKQEPIDYIEIPNLPQCDGAVYVTGDSMYPLLKSVDIIAYKVLNQIANIFWGEMYLLSILMDGDSFITVKYVQRTNKDGWVKLVSQNQHHQEKEIPFDSIKFAALVKASIRINSMG